MQARPKAGSTSSKEHGPLNLRGPLFFLHFRYTRFSWSRHRLAFTRNSPARLFPSHAHRECPKKCFVAHATALVYGWIQWWLPTWLHLRNRESRFKNIKQAAKSEAVKTIWYFFVCFIPFVLICSWKSLNQKKLNCRSIPSLSCFIPFSKIGSGISRKELHALAREVAKVEVVRVYAGELHALSFFYFNVIFQKQH